MLLQAHLNHAVRQKTGPLLRHISNLQRNRIRTVPVLAPSDLLFESDTKCNDGLILQEAFLR